MTTTKSLKPGWAALMLALSVIPGAASAQTLPNPVLFLVGQEPYTVRGTNFVRYRFDVMNKDVYPAAMFAAAPQLPPCGNNTNSSRTWVDIFDKSGDRLYGFCAFSSPANLGQLWFALPEGEVPPSWVYIELRDRQTNAVYRSNLAETTL